MLRRVTATLGLVAALTTSMLSPSFASAESSLPQKQPVQYPGAPVPAILQPADYLGYVSDLSSYPYGIYYDVVKDFHGVQKNQALMAQNMDTVVRINNTATPVQIARAQADAVADTGGVLTAFSDAFGPRLGQMFNTALAEGRLPLTQLLFGNGWGARAGGLASSTLIEKVVFNNPRPFMAAPERIHYYNVPGKNLYLSSKSFPSGHTNQATWATTLLAVIVPEAATQLLARGAEAGYNRMVMGVHYPLDVMGGRMTGLAAAADRWNDPKMRELLNRAGWEIRHELEWRCGDTLANCLAKDTPYQADPVKMYTENLNYGFAVNLDAPLVIPQQAPDLLLTTHPELNWQQRAQLLALTAIPAGSPLTNSWGRLNLAAAMAAQPRLDAQGNVLL